MNKYTLPLVSTIVLVFLVLMLPRHGPAAVKTADMSTQDTLSAAEETAQTILNSPLVPQPWGSLVGAGIALLGALCGFFGRGHADRDALRQRRATDSPATKESARHPFEKN